ncbi:hypothetical protein ACSBR2_004325 [Camellia fascicularis]
MIGVNATSKPDVSSDLVHNTSGEVLGAQNTCGKLGFVQNRFEVLNSDTMDSLEDIPQDQGLGKDRRAITCNQLDRRVETLDLGKNLSEGTVHPHRSSETHQSVMKSSSADGVQDLEANRASKTLNLTFDPQIIADRLARIKSSNYSTVAPPTPATPRWSEQSEGENSKFQSLPDSLVIARNRGEGKTCNTKEVLNSDPSIVPVQGSEGVFQEDDCELVTEGAEEEEVMVVAGGFGTIPGKSWAEVTKASNRSNVPLKYVPPTCNEDVISVELPPRPNPLEKWDSCLVGYFIGKGVNFNYMKNSAFGLWKNSGLKEVLANGEGFIFFIFDSPECCIEVLQGGPWYIGGFNIILKKWTRMMKLSKDKVTKVPVWVRFYNIPMEYWDNDGLSRIASAVGHPLFTDQLTANGGLPARCEHCVAFGHDTLKCVTNQVAKLVPVSQQATSAKGKSSGKGSNSQRKNKRGMNDPTKQREIKTFVLKEEIKVMGILETKIKVDTVFLAGFVYAENTHALRRVFFESMVRLSHSQSKSPIIFLGDFNATRFSHEKFGGSQNWSSAKEEFNSFILDSELDDLSYTGCQFTWANKREGVEYIASKIDRVLINESWLDKFPNSTANFLPSGVSDHSPAVVTISDEVTSYKKPFKFFNFWSKHEDFLPLVANEWSQYIHGVPMFRVCQKLRNLKSVLKALNKKRF